MIEIRLTDDKGKYSVFNTKTQEYYVKHVSTSQAIKVFINEYVLEEYSDFFGTIGYHRLITEVFEKLFVKFLNKEIEYVEDINFSHISEIVKEIEKEFYE